MFVFGGFVVQYFGVFKDILHQWNDNDPAIVYCEKVYTYGDLKEKVEHISNLISDKIPTASVVTLKSDMSFDGICAFIALCNHQCIIVPVSTNSLSNLENFHKTAQSDYIIEYIENHLIIKEQKSISQKHPYYEELYKRKTAGLVVFSSGSSGEPKGAVHDLNNIFEKFTKPRKKLTTLSFLLFDHLGGINTFLYNLSSGGCLVIPQNKLVGHVLALVEKFSVNLLPTSPSFLNLVLASRLYDDYDLSSLQIVSYGTELMHEETLNKLSKVFPDVILQQTYGLTEIGVLRSKSQNNKSLWVKLGGKEFQTRVVEGKLQIKGKSTMIGYLNAPNPFTADGWLQTGDNVLVDGEYYKILGRDTDIIIVGGQKVYPSEVESVILQMKEVDDVAVYSEKNSLLGSIVCAKIIINKEYVNINPKKLIKEFCVNKLEKFKIPVKVIATDSIVNNRFKKIRN